IQQDEAREVQSAKFLEGDDAPTADVLRDAFEQLLQSGILTSANPGNYVERFLVGHPDVTSVPKAKTGCCAAGGKTHWVD
ncbi:MAG: hypothetical protein QOE82_868, partial [Thermoanaerobaculia bacterium]|nr:hypothetical protein [Thermoanaerobaculia bacterium]